MFPELTAEQVETVAQAIRDFFAGMGSVAA
jgi:hypothetical protein